MDLIADWFFAPWQQVGYAACALWAFFHILGHFSFPSNRVLREGQQPPSLPPIPRPPRGGTGESHQRTDLFVDSVMMNGRCVSFHATYEQPSNT